jgi:hypothetical protein
MFKLVIMTTAGNEKDRTVSKEIASPSDFYLVCVQALNLIGRKATLSITSDRAISIEQTNLEHFVAYFDLEWPILSI